MATVQKILAAVLSGASDAGIRFAELDRLLLAVGFQKRVRGGHHIFSRLGVEEIINLQPLPGSKAKPYHVKPVRQIVAKYRLDAGEDR